MNSATQKVAPVQSTASESLSDRIGLLCYPVVDFAGHGVTAQVTTRSDDNYSRWRPDPKEQAGPALETLRGAARCGRIVRPPGVYSK
jgi:hypothetical protein